jgi:hypothetical protein
VQTDVVFTHRFSHCWNHGLGEIITAVLDAGMRSLRATRDVGTVEVTTRLSLVVGDVRRA